MQTFRVPTVEDAQLLFDLLNDALMRAQHTNNNERVQRLALMVIDAHATLRSFREGN